MTRKVRLLIQILIFCRAVCTFLIFTVHYSILMRVQAAVISRNDDVSSRSSHYASDPVQRAFVRETCRAWKDPIAGVLHMGTAEAID